MSDLPKAPKTRPLLHAFDLIIIGVVCLCGAALATFVPGFFICDVVGDWYEKHVPQGPGQTPPSYWAENGSFGHVLGLVFGFSILIFCFIRRKEFLRAEEHGKPE